MTPQFYERHEGEIYSWISIQRPIELNSNENAATQGRYTCFKRASYIYKYIQVKDIDWKSKNIITIAKKIEC